MDDSNTLINQEKIPTQISLDDVVQIYSLSDLKKFEENGVLLRNTCFFRVNKPEGDSSVVSVGHLVSNDVTNKGAHFFGYLFCQEKNDKENTHDFFGRRYRCVLPLGFYLRDEDLLPTENPFIESQKLFLYRDNTHRDLYR